jgi:hypothetical protein
MSATHVIDAVEGITPAAVAVCRKAHAQAVPLIALTHNTGQDAAATTLDGVHHAATAAAVRNSAGVEGVVYLTQGHAPAAMRAHTAAEEKTERVPAAGRGSTTPTRVAPTSQRAKHVRLENSTPTPAPTQLAHARAVPRARTCWPLAPPAAITAPIVLWVSTAPVPEQASAAPHVLQGRTPTHWAPHSARPVPQARMPPPPV